MGLDEHPKRDVAVHQDLGSVFSRESGCGESEHGRTVAKTMYEDEDV